MLFGPKMQSSFTPNKVDSDEIQGLETADCYWGVSCKPVIISNECATISYEITPHPPFSLSFTHTHFFSAQKNTHYILVFDGFVILVCLTSAVLCTRSIVLAIRLLQVSWSLAAHPLSIIQCCFIHKVLPLVSLSDYRLQLFALLNF